MKKLALLIAMLLAMPAIAKDSSYPAEIVVRLGKTRPERPVPFPEIRDWKTLKITLARTPCFGTCPGYKVEIDGEGNVEYEGGYFVAVRGRRHEKVSAQSVHDLYAQFKKADFFWLFDDYQAAVTDNPTYRIGISFDGHSKEVLDYLGTRVGMPPEVRDLEQKIDAVADTRRWVEGSDDRPQKRH